MTQIIRSMWNDEAGQDLVEYALLIALIAIVVAAAMPALATAITDVFNAIKNCVADPTGAACKV